MGGAVKTAKQNALRTRVITAKAVQKSGDKPLESHFGWATVARNATFIRYLMLCLFIVWILLTLLGKSPTQKELWMPTFLVAITTYTHSLPFWNQSSSLIQDTRS